MRLTGVRSDECLVMSGEVEANKWCRTVECYNLKTNRWRHETQLSRLLTVSRAVPVVDPRTGLVYVFCLHTVGCYNPHNCNWEALPQSVVSSALSPFIASDKMHYPRTSTLCAVWCSHLDGIIICGDTVIRQYYRTIELYKPVDNTFILLTERHPATFDCTRHIDDVIDKKTGNLFICRHVVLFVYVKKSKL